MNSLSPKEQALWLFQQYTAERGVLNVPFAVKSRRPLRWWPLNEALLAMARRHVHLRTLFPETDGVPRRDALAADSPLLREAPLHIQSSTPERIDRDLADFLGRPFDLTSELPFRAGQFCLDDGDILLVSVSHMVCDAVSATVLQEELMEAYCALLTENELPVGLSESVPAPALDESSQEGVSYWAARLAGVRSRELALGKHGQRDSMYPGDRVLRPMADAAAKAVTELSERTSVSRNLVFLAAFNLLLARHGAGEDILVAVPVGDRGVPPHRAVGYYVNILPVRTEVKPELPVREFLRRTRDQFLADLAHSRVPLQELAVAYDSTDGRADQVLRHMFNYSADRVAAETTKVLSGNGFTPMHVPSHHCRMDLEFGIGEAAHPKLKVAYAADVFGRSEVEAMVCRYEQILVDLLARLDGTLDEVEAMTDSDRLTLQAVDRGVLDEAGRLAPPGVWGWIDGSPARITLDGRLERAVESPPQDGPQPRAGRPAQPAEVVADLVEMWCLVLGRDDVHADTNFFGGGGDSMLAAKLVSQIKKRRGVKVSMRAVFRAPTPSMLAAELTALAGSD